MNKYEEGNLNEPSENEQYTAPKPRPPTPQPPAAWRSGADWDLEEGEVTSEPLTMPNPDWTKILQEWGYDPETHEVVEPVKVSAWDAQVADGGIKRLWSFKAGVQTKPTLKDEYYDELVREIKNHRVRKNAPPEGDLSFYVFISDCQFGKGDGDGLRGTVERFTNAIDAVENRIKELRKIGRPLGKLVVVGLGDIIESCSQNYASQPFTVEANLRQQLRIARRLIRDALIRWSKLFNDVVVTCVPGNHGESRLAGKMYTTYGDNFDVSVFENIAEIFDANPAVFGHVKFLIPEDDICVVLEDGPGIGFAHGHISKGGSMPQQKLISWWKDQTFGSMPLASAKILVTGHYHHFSVVEVGDRIHIQCPSLDGGSTWWEHLSGESSRSGMLTFVLNERGYQDIEVL